MDLNQIVDLTTYPIEKSAFRAACRKTYEDHGILVMPQFVTQPAIEAIQAEGRENEDKVFASSAKHTVYLSPQDPNFAADHPRNRLVVSSKGCITDDLMPQQSALRTLYNAPEFRAFLCEVLGEEAL